MKVFLLTKHNFYPETRVQDGAEWSEECGIFFTREDAEAEQAEVIKRIEAEHRDPEELDDPDYVWADDPDRDEFNIQEMEVKHVLWELLWEKVENILTRASWDTDNSGQIVIYTGLQAGDNPIELTVKDFEVEP